MGGRKRRSYKRLLRPTRLVGGSWDPREQIDRPWASIDVQWGSQQEPRQIFRYLVSNGNEEGNFLHWVLPEMNGWSEEGKVAPNPATHPTQVKKGFGGPIGLEGLQVNFGWNGDCGLLFLKCDCGSFLHAQRKQKFLARRQIPQGLKRGQAEQGVRGAA